MIGIIVAMDLECELLRETGKHVKSESVCGINFEILDIHETRCVVAVCGIGKVNAARVSQTMIIKYSPEFIINTGVGGGLREDMNIGDIVVSDRVLQHDMNTTAIGDMLGFLSSPPLVYIPADEALSDRLVSEGEKLGFPVKKGTIATGDLFVYKDKHREKIRDTFSADICEMEGGAIGQVCYLSKTPFVVIRAVSDGGNADSTVDYPTFAKKAARNSADLLISFISTL